MEFVCGKIKDSNKEISISRRLFGGGIDRNVYICKDVIWERRKKRKGINDFGFLAPGSWP